MGNDVNIIKSGFNLEIYHYEYEFAGHRGRPRGYKVVFDRANLVNGGGDALLESKYKRRQDNARRASLAFRRIVQSNLGGIETPLLCTFTFAENRGDVRECARFFHIFTIRMRGQFGAGFRYIAVPEFQKRGAVHYHVLFWGLPDSVYKQERKLRAVAGLWKEGFVDMVKTDGDLKLAGYLAKYMMKAIQDRRLFYHKAYFASRNILRPVVGRGIPYWWVEDEYELAKAQLLTKKEFLTQWRGRALYKNYLLEKV